MAVLTESADSGRRILLKGAPDRLLDRCQWQADASGQSVRLDRDFWEKAINELSDQGLRVLAAASREVDGAKESLVVEDLEDDMVFLGVVGNTLVFGQIFYLFNSRFLRQTSLRIGELFTNKAVWIAVGALLCLQLVFVYAPFMHLTFGSAPLELRHWLLPLAAGAIVFFIVEAEKALISGRRPKR